MWQIFVSRQGQMGLFGKLCNDPAGCNTTTDSGSNGFILALRKLWYRQSRIRCFLNPLLCFGLFLLGQRIAFPEAAIVIALDRAIGFRSV
jgi:hypothetical protein